MIEKPTTGGVSRKTVVLFCGLVVLVGLIVWPSLLGRIRYAQTRAELRAIRDAAMVAELSSVGKLFTTLARVIGPSVVNVTGVRRVQTFVDEITALRGGVPTNLVDESVGSGLIISSDGYIATNYHVVSQSEAIEIRLADKRVFQAQLVGADAATDLAVLKIRADELPVADWGDSETLEVGEMVWAIGNPYGLERTLTYGIVSGMGRRGVVGNPLRRISSDGCLDQPWQLRWSTCGCTWQGNRDHNCDCWEKFPWNRVCNSEYDSASYLRRNTSKWSR